MEFKKFDVNNNGLCLLKILLIFNLVRNISCFLSFNEIMSMVAMLGGGYGQTGFAIQNPIGSGIYIQQGGYEQDCYSVQGGYQKSNGGYDGYDEQNESFSRLSSFGEQNDHGS